jgi:uncharacterized protein YbjT (DUF2867 family)
MKTVLVIGATGAQGGSVASHLLDRRTFAVRALTRNPDSPAAQTLRARGAEVVRGELDDRGSLRAALKGVDAVFGVTNYWEHFEKEAEHGRNLINAVAGAEVEHFVLSTLPSVDAWSKGELKSPHFDQKYEMEQYARSLGLPATFVHVAFYYDNFFSFFPPQKNGDGRYHFAFNQGEVPLAGVAAEDIGGVVAGILEHPDAYLGKTVGIVGDDLTPEQYALAMSRASGKSIIYDYVPREVFAKFPFKGADDLADMFEFNRRFYPNRLVDLAQSRAIYPGMQSFEQWISKRGDKVAA